MEEANLTYQDRVFITDVLKKLGVREVNQFMKQVFRLKQETRTTERLISLYWNHLGGVKRAGGSLAQSRKRTKDGGGTSGGRTAGRDASSGDYEPSENRSHLSDPE